jgi:membrane-bound lytic murein transglycosylase D
VLFWTEERRAHTVRAINRSGRHLDSIRRELRVSLLPEVFCYLPFIESGYLVAALTPVGARGLWQFMPDTARRYGLRVDDEVDERTDPLLATRAACRYLNDLLAMFGADAFMCAVGSYNSGEYRMSECLRGVNWRSRWKFVELVKQDNDCLKRETIEYVPRFLAAAIVMRHPEAFDLPRPGAD